MKEEEGEMESKKAAGMQEKRMKERTCKSTRLTNLNGFFEVHKS